MQFEIKKARSILAKTPQVLSTLLSNLSEDWTHHNEGGESWCPYDIVGHLIHGENTDWIPRALIILTAPKKEFEPYDRFAQFENSKSKTLADLLSEFEGLRKKNLEILDDLEINETTLAMEAQHPELGPVNLINLLAAWVVHDLGHIAQISRVMAKQYREEIGIWAEYMPVVN